MGCHFLLQGIFLTQGSNSGLLHCRQILYRLSYRSSLKVSSFLICLFLILFCGSDLYYSVSQSTYSFFSVSYSASNSFQCIFHFTYCIVHLYLFILISPKSLLSIFCIFSILPPFFPKILDHLHCNNSKFFFQ